MAGGMQAGVAGLKERLKKSVESKTVDDVSAEETDPEFEAKKKAQIDALNDAEQQDESEQETEESSEDEIPFGN